MDPGNWATDLGRPVWIFLTLGFIEVTLWLFAKFKCAIRIVTQRLAQASRETYSPFINYILILAEVLL
jgi:manganese transport protein